MELKICNQKFDMKREIHTDTHFTPDNIILSFRFEKRLPFLDISLNNVKMNDGQDQLLREVYF